MADREEVTRLGRLLGSVADQHHEATGGASDRWAEWYADKLHGSIDEFLGYKPTVEQIIEWLREADRRYRSEAPGVPWPFYYAELILDSPRTITS